MISKTKIDRKMQRKTSRMLAETIMKIKKHDKWMEIAHMISGPTRLQSSVNLNEIDKESKEGDTIFIPGKVLGNGHLSKKIRIVALYFSAEARKKAKEKKCELVTILDELKVNPKAQGIKILK